MGRDLWALCINGKPIISLIKKKSLPPRRRPLNNPNRSSQNDARVQTQAQKRASWSWGLRRDWASRIRKGEWQFAEERKDRSAPCWWAVTLKYRDQNLMCPWNYKQSGALRLCSLKHQAIKICQFKRPGLAFVTWSSAIATDIPLALKQLKSV